MLTLVSLPEIENMLAKEKHYLYPEDLHKEARRLYETLDPRLDNVLSVYAKEGKYTDFQYDNMSVITITSLRHCGFLEAVILMDAFLKNPEDGLAQIVRR